MVDRTCQACGTSFRVAASRLRHGRGKHCSKACQYETRRRAPKKLVALTCVGCGITFYRNPSQTRNTKGAGKFCNRACRDTNRMGPKHPQWINETTHGPRYYGANWQAQKRKAKARDGCCQECGATTRLAVHHIMPIRLWPTKEAANSLSNLVALCAACHRRVEAARQWVKLGDDSGALAFTSGGPVHEMAKERGIL